MGGSSSQVTGYRYFTNLLLFIGNPIEKMLGINFDKRGWLSPFVDENSNALAQGVINSPSLFGENEGGVAGVVHVQYGTDNQDVLPFYKDYMESIGLQASAYPYQSYLAFTGLGSVKLDGLAGGVFNTLMPYNNAFYVGNSGYMKEMLLWPKRIHVRNDGREQWYGEKAEILQFSPYQPGEVQEIELMVKISCDGLTSESTATITEWGKEDQLEVEATGVPMGGWHGEAWFDEDTSEHGSTMMLFYAISSVDGINRAKATFVVNDGFDETYRPGIAFMNPSSIISYKIDTYDGGDLTRFEIDYTFAGASSGISVIVEPHVHTSGQHNNAIGLASASIFIPRPGRTSAVNANDINPIHKIREILTDDTAMNKPESSVNDENFKKAADRIYDEGLGISWSITEKSCIDAINELCYHIEAGIRVNRQTGLYEMVLFRDDWFEEDEIHSIPENKIKKGSMQYEITNADEVVNKVNVNYYDRENIKNSSFSISESGLIQTQGRENAETVDFPYFMNMRNAEIVANWKLKILSTGVLKGSFTTGWREARKWNRYDLIRLPWSKRWTGTILVRIMSIKLGSPTSNEVSIDFIEVVPATGMMNTTIVADDPIDKPLPPQACQYEPFELPYYLAAMLLGQRKADEELAYESNFGLVGVVAEKPQENSLYAVMMTNNYDEWVRAGSIQYSETVDSDQWISKVSTSFTVKNWKKIANVPVGTLIQCGKEWLTGFFEWMVFQGVDPHTGVVSVKRGALDTQPQDWDLGLKLYFCGIDVAYDATEYVAGEKVLVSALTTTPSGVLELKGSHSVEMKARAIRPYPPANVKINGEYWPETQLVTNNIVLTWAHRNRVQQTGGEIIGWFEGGVTVESGVVYSIELTCENVVLYSIDNVSANTHTIPHSILKPNKAHKVKLWSFRDGYSSYQVFEHDFFAESLSLILSATATKSAVTGNTVPLANVSATVDESLSANLRFDGKNIKIKTLPGSNITIEVN